MLYIYAYVDGSDLEEVEGALSKAFSEFVAASTLPNIKFISFKHTRTPDLHPDDLAQWDMGINFSTSSLSEEHAIHLVAFLARLSQETGRDFAIGNWQPDRQISEVLMFVESNTTLSTAKELAAMLAGR